MRTSRRTGEQGGIHGHCECIAASAQVRRTRDGHHQSLKGSALPIQAAEVPGMAGLSRSAAAPRARGSHTIPRPLPAAGRMQTKWRGHFRPGLRTAPMQDTGRPIRLPGRWGSGDRAILVARPLADQARAWPLQPCTPVRAKSSTSGTGTSRSVADACLLSPRPNSPILLPTSNTAGRQRVVQSITQLARRSNTMPGDPSRSRRRCLGQTCRCRSVSGDVARGSSSRGGCSHPISATTRCSTERCTTSCSTLAMTDAGT